MRIGILSPRPFPPAEADGIASYVYHLVRKLVEKGHDVTLITRGSLRLQQESASDHLRIFRVPILSTYPFHVHIHGIFISRLITMLEPELDIINAHSPYVPAVTTTLPLMTTIHTLERGQGSVRESRTL